MREREEKLFDGVRKSIVLGLEEYHCIQVQIAGLRSVSGFSGQSNGPWLWFSAERSNTTISFSLQTVCDQISVPTEYQLQTTSHEFKILTKCFGKVPNGCGGGFVIHTVVPLASSLCHSNSPKARGTDCITLFVQNYNC